MLLHMVTVPLIPSLTCIQAPTHPVYNICPEKVAKAIQFFHKLPVPAQRESPHHL